MVEQQQNGTEPDLEVEDAEGYVDRERKKDILKNRRKVEETAEYVFPRAKRGELGPATAAGHFHEPVRNYLISIEPLLKDFDLPDAEQVYLHEPMAELVFSPPAEFTRPDGIPSETQLKERGYRVLGEPPEPEEHTIRGLKEIIERDRYDRSWEVTIEPLRGIRARRTAQKTETVTDTQVTPKRALWNAVRTADTWLQQAGIGLELGTGDPHGQT